MGKENLDEFNSVLKEFENWIRNLPNEEQKGILEEAIQSIHKYIKKAEEKKKMYEDIGMDKTDKLTANKGYSQY